MELDTLKLYEINDHLRLALDAVNDLAEASEGEIPDSWATFLDEINMAKENKILDIGRYIKSLKAQAVGIKLEIDNLQKRYKGYTNQIERLTNYLSWNMTNEEKYKDYNTSISFRKSSRVNIHNPDLIPSLYLKTEVTIMKSLIKKDISNGIDVEGATVDPSYTLTIK